MRILVSGSTGLVGSALIPSLVGQGHEVIRHGPDLRLPWSRAMGQGLFELRPRGQSLTCRVLYGFASDRTIVIVHAFTKKSRQTPDRDLRLARRRMKEWHRE